MLWGVIAQNRCPVTEKADAKAAAQAEALKATVDSFGQFLAEKYYPYLRNSERAAPESFIRILDTKFKHLHRHRLEDIAAKHILQYQTEQRIAGLKPSTINRHVAELKSAITWAHVNGYLDMNNLRGIPQLTMDKNVAPRYLTP